MHQHSHVLLILYYRVRHQNGIPDVCESAVIHKVTSSGKIDVAIFRYAFNR